MRDAMCEIHAMHKALHKMEDGTATMKPMDASPAA